MGLDAVGPHPFLAHFPVALSVASLAGAIWSLFDSRVDRRLIAVTLTIILLIGVSVSSILTAFTGWLAQASASRWTTFPAAEPVLDIHRLLGIVFAVSAPLLSGLAAVNFKEHDKPGYRAGLLVVSLLLSALALATGYYGGELVFRHGIGVLPLL